MKPPFFLNPAFHSRSSWLKLAGIFLYVVFAGMVSGQVYVNQNPIAYEVPNGPTPPQFDDTSFVNDSTFSITYNQFENNQMLYSEPWVGTIYFTNNGEMSVGSGIGNSYGFEFDTLVGNSSVMAGTFNNPGTIHANSELDGNFGVGACIVSATNIIMQGQIEVGDNGAINISGQNINLSGSELTLENGLGAGTGNAPFTGTGKSGLTTNAWEPLLSLTNTSALSADFPPLFPFGFFLPNTTPYNLETGSNLNRSAFVENDSLSNVTYNVFFGVGALGSGETTVGWVGSYLNYATGQVITNYLYLNDDYLAGAVTNVPIGANGYPINFTLTASLFSQTGTNMPAVANLPVFPAVTISNAPYVFGTFISSSLSLTNSSVDNPGGSITNLANRITINASKELNLNFAQISGPTYMSIISTNQFDGSAGAQISSLYSDLNLGVTNGNLTVSNLVASQIPEWSGSMEAWSVRFFVITTNISVTMSNSVSMTNMISFTNDWRTVLVEGDLTPDSIPQIDNLFLNVTNNLVISDALNVYGAFTATPRSLTLTTNFENTGAVSPEGEINLENPNSPTWTWLSSFPNLLYLTNNGTISTPNFANIVGSTQAVVVTGGMPASPAMATLSESGTNVMTNSTVTIAGIAYTFTNTVGKPSSAYAVKIGPTFDASMTNLIAAINFSTGGGQVYSTNGSYANGFVTANALAVGAFNVTAVVPGTSGNSIPVQSSSSANLVWSGSFLSGGATSVPGTTNLVPTSIPYGAIINNGIISDEGAAISVGNFENGGTFSNNLGSFALDAVSATLTNGSILAGGDVSIAAGTLITSNFNLVAGRSLTLDVTNSITDYGVSNANTWIVGSVNATGFSGLGLILPTLPSSNPGNLLGTTIYLPTPGQGKTVSSTWAGADDGPTLAGYNANNVAIGRLMLDALGPNSTFVFNGASTGNAMYVDQLVLSDYAGTNFAVGTNLPAISINTNMMIYYADAISSTGVGSSTYTDVSSFLNHYNGNRLQWVQGYNGLFTSTNVTIPVAFVSGVVLPAKPAINGALSKGGNFMLSISGSYPQVVIQASTNLVDWTNISTNVPPFTFTDTVSSAFKTRFYRAVGSNNNGM
jgi:hypothetical protein